MAGANHRRLWSEGLVMPPSDVEKRLAEVELQLQEIRKLRMPGGGISDPAPDDWWWRYPFPRWPRFPFPWNPVVDPQPEPWGTNFGGFENAGVARRAGGVFGPNVDPSPIDFSRFTE